MKIYTGSSGYAKTCGTICAQKASIDNGLGKGKWRFRVLKSGILSGGFFISGILHVIWDSSCKLLNIYLEFHKY